MVIEGAGACGRGGEKNIALVPTTGGTMQLELSTDEARLLQTQLGRRITELDAELVRTDKYELQHSLDQEVEKLRAIEERLTRLLGA
jgi:hypothetical protein